MAQVWQTERRVQVHRRQKHGWSVDDYGASDTVTLSGGVTLTVSDLYP